MDTVSGDVFLAECARFIRYNEAKLGNVPAAGTTAAAGVWYNPVKWLPATTTAKPNQGPAPRAAAPPAQTPQARARPLPLRVSAHHLFYLLLRCEELGLPIGPLDVRIPAPSRPSSYFAFISRSAAGSGSRRKDNDETMSVSSLQTTMSTLTALGSGNFTGSNGWWSSAKEDPSANVKYIYSAMTKIPALRIIPPPLKTIRDFEDCPGDMSVPLEAFKNVQYLDFEDVDPRTFIGWDKLSLQLKSLSMKHSGVEDVTDIIVDAVIDDGRRRRGEPVARPRRSANDGDQQDNAASAEGDSAARLQEANGSALKAEEISASLPSLSWHFLRHLGLSDNSLTFLHSTPISCASGLTSLDLSNNLLNSVPPCLHLLPNLRSLNVSNNLIDSVLGIPAALPAIEALNISHNRLESLCGLERLMTLRRVDLRRNEVVDAGEFGRLATLPSIAEIYVARNPIFEEEEDARVLILAEFAREGLSLDRIKVDDELAGYFERQRVRERVPNMDRLMKARSAGNTDTQKSSRPAAAQRQESSQSVDRSEETATSAAPVVRNVRHRAGHRHGAKGARPVEVENASSTDKEAQQRRNRRIVDLHNSMHEAQGQKDGAPSSPALPTDTSDSDAIKKAAREGKLEEAMGAVAIISDAEAHASSTADDQKAAARQPKPRVKIARRGMSSGADSPISKDLAATSAADSLETPRSPGGEELRRRIEALKGEVGDDWMRLLARGESVYVPETSRATTGSSADGKKNDD